MSEEQREAPESPWDHVGPGSSGGRLLRSAWHPIYRTCDLVAAAPPVRIAFLAEHFTLYRGASGRPVLLEDRCPHRGTLLSLGSLEGDDVRCHHHGWRFDAQGRGVERRGESVAMLGRCHARAYPLQEYLGLVFAWLGEGAPVPLPRYPAYEARGTLRVLPVDVWRCSFFQRLENSCDVSHVASAHVRSGVGASLDGGLTITATDTSEGLRVEAEVNGTRIPPVRFVLPNVLEFATPVSDAVGWLDHLVWRVPIDDDRCASFVVSLVPDTVPNAKSYAFDRTIPLPFTPGDTARLGDDVLAGRQRLDSLKSGSLTEIEDYVALVGQGTAVERTHEVLGPLDAPVVALRRRWRAAASSGTLAE